MQKEWPKEWQKEWQKEWPKENPYHLVTYHISDYYQTRDLSGNNPENIPPLEDGEYIQFMQDVNMAVRMGALIISVYTDASGIGIALDSSGNPILNRLLKTTSYVYPHIDNEGNYIYGVLTNVYDDGSTFSNINTINNTLYWYSIQGVSDQNNLQQYT